MTNHSMPCIRPSRACSLLRLRLLPQRRRGGTDRLCVAPASFDASTSTNSTNAEQPVSFAPAAYPVHASNESAAKPVSETPSVAPTAVAAAEPPVSAPSAPVSGVTAGSVPSFAPAQAAHEPQLRHRPVGVRGTARGYGAERFLFGRSRPHGCGFSGTSGSGCTVLRS